MAGKWAFSIPAAKVPAGAHNLLASATGGAVSTVVTVTAVSDIVKPSGNIRYSGGGLGGCSTTGSTFGLWLALGALVLLRRRR